MTVYPRHDVATLCGMKKKKQFRLSPADLETLKRLAKQNQSTQTAEVEAAIRERGQKQLQPPQS